MSENEEQCTCNDEFVTAPCPIHFPQTGSQYTGQVIIIDDNFICDQGKPIYVKGKAFFQFICPNCRVDSIFHQMKYCPECGSQVKIQSITATNFIREQYGMKPQ